MRACGVTVFLSDLSFARGHGPVVVEVPYRAK